MFTYVTTALTFAAQPALIAAESTDETGGSLLGFLLPLIIIGGLFYFLLIMPQRRMRRQQETMQASLSPGDEVRTVGGMFGTIVSVNDDDTVTLSISPTTDIRLASRAVAQILKDVPDDEGNDTT